MDIPKAFRNIVQQLQTDPVRYKLFGIYWWPIKKLLKGAGYGPDQLPMLGDYQDDEIAAHVGDRMPTPVTGKLSRRRDATLPA